MNAEQIRNSWDDDHDVTQPCAFPEPLAEVLTRENRELRAEVERWKDKANEAGASYATANTKHHEELDRANRLERLADTLAGRAVELEDIAADATTAAQNLRDELQGAQERLRAVEALAESWRSDLSRPRSMHRFTAAALVRQALNGYVQQPQHRATAANCAEGNSCGAPISSGVVCPACPPLDDDDPAWLHRAALDAEQEDE